MQGVLLPALNRLQRGDGLDLERVSMLIVRYWQCHRRTIGRCVLAAVVRLKMQYMITNAMSAPATKAPSINHVNIDHQCGSRPRTDGSTDNRHGNVAFGKRRRNASKQQTQSKGVDVCHLQ